jgi:hypothetical protein
MVVVANLRLRWVWLRDLGSPSHSWLLFGRLTPPPGSSRKWFIRGQLLNTLSKMEPNELKKLAAPSPCVELSVFFLRLE